MPGLLTGEKSDMFLFEIGLGFGEHGGTTYLTKNSQE